MMSEWLNKTKIINEDVEKPCVKLGYCPYGELVEEFPFSVERKLGIGYSQYSCAEQNGAIVTFGHDCPVHYLGEYIESEQKSPV